MTVQLGRTRAKSLAVVSFVAALALGGCAAPGSTLTKTAESRVVASGRFCHIGLVWLKEQGDIAQQRRIIDAAHAFGAEIPEVRRISAGRAPRAQSTYVDDSFDICLVMEFDNRAALERYSRHPVHAKAAQEAFLPLSKKILFYDFITE
jgi:hypothetical protein